MYNMKIIRNSNLINCRKYSQASFKTILSDHKTFTCQRVEELCHERWKKLDLYSSKNHQHSKPPFIMCLPPPNVTGNLHMGHALAFTIEDLMARWHRMLGYNVSWVPGLDHAGIATQVVVEKELYNKSFMTRHQLGREAFLQEVWKWKHLKENEIKSQLNAMGLSLDWSREFFTLSPNLNKSVNEAFIRLYQRDLIYRDLRLVNWSCQLKSTISDIEVEMLQIDGSTSISVPGYRDPVTFGVLHTFSYPLASPTNQCKSIDVATTRIETMLGDTGIAVHPDDPRYSHLIGQRVSHPLIGGGGRELPIIADSSVDPSVGTGAVKLTPAHSPIDFEMSRQHNLDLINIISDDGRICNTGGEFDGLPRFVARERVVKALVSLGLYKGCTTDHQMVLPLCSRSGDIVEYLMREQWFMRCQGAANKILKAIDSDAVKIKPSNDTVLLKQWLEDCSDWCISRQLWWGHRIPAYKITRTHLNENTPEWIVANTRPEAEAEAAKLLGIDASEFISSDLIQDEDVLDTWFSSSLIPFSIFGWPDQTEDLNRFYPNQMLETGKDIVFFWVARMMMMGIELTDKLPFNEVYLHGIICDKNGRKMSKSEGNVVDPMSLIKGIGDFDKEKLFGDMESFGADSLRFSLMNYNSSTQQIPFNMSDLIASFKFCNKIWQTARFIQLYKQELLSNHSDQQSRLSQCFDWSMEEKNDWLISNWSSLSETNRWILSVLHQTVNFCHNAFEDREFHLIPKDIRVFWWNSLCDVYLEVLKTRLKHCQSGDLLGDAVTLMMVLDITLRLLHPIMPHITETVWLSLCTAEEKGDYCLLLESMPTPDNFILPISIDEKKDLTGRMKELFRVIRIINELKLIIRGSHKSMSLQLKEKISLIDDEFDLLKSLTRLRENGGDMETDRVITVHLDHDISLLIDQKQCNHLTALENLQSRLVKQEKRRQTLDSKLAVSKSNNEISRITAKKLEMDEQIATLQEKIDLIHKHFSQNSSNSIESSL